VNPPLDSFSSFLSIPSVLFLFDVSAPQSGHNRCQRGKPSGIRGLWEAKQCPWGDVLASKGKSLNHVKEVPMNVNVRLIVHGLLLVLGIVLMVGGIITGKHGATVIGLVVAAVNIQQFLSRKKANTDERIGQAH
jgi:hypothetical protein